MIEYVLPGQNVENWRELVTSQVFSQAVPLAAFVERLRASLSQGCSSLVWNVVRQEEKTLIYEWRDSGCGGFEPQHELDRVTIQKDGLYRLAYAAKVKGPLAPERRKEWLDILTRVPLAESGARQPSSPEGPSQSGSKPSAAPKTLTTEQLAAGVRKSGWPCPAGLKSEIKGETPGPQGPLVYWTLQCSNGQRYSVLVDPAGSMTSFQTPK